MYRSTYTSSYVTRVDVLSQDTGSSSTTFTDTTPESMTRYGYAVSALDGDVEGALSNQIRLTTNPVANTPTRPQNVRISQNQDGDVVLAWDAPAHIPVTPCTYDVYRDRLVNASGLSALTYTDTEAEPDTRYFYAVWATCGGYTSDLEMTYINTGTRETGVPYRPHILYRAAEPEAAGIKLSWVVNDPSATHFVLARELIVSPLPEVEESFTDVTIDAADADEDGVVEYEDTKVIEGSSYLYRLRARTGEGTTAAPYVYSDADVYTVTARRFKDKPLGVSNLRATDMRVGAVALEWDAPDMSGDNPTVTGYRVHREHRFDSTVTTLTDTLPSTATTYQDAAADLIPGARYAYYVTAFNAAGNGKIAEVSFNALPSGAEAPTDGSGGGQDPPEEPEAPVLGEPSRPPRPGTSATAAVSLTEGSPYLAVTWDDDPATDVVCHDHYKVNLFYPDRSMLSREPAHTTPPSGVQLAYNPHEDIEINAIQVVLGLISPHLRSLTVPVDGAIEPSGRKVRVWCGQPTAPDSLLIGETDLPEYTPPLVSNLAQAEAGQHSLASLDIAQAFTTGADIDGYNLERVELRLQTGAGTVTPTVRILSGSAAGTVVANLAGPASLDADTTREYTFTVTVSLSASTQYWVVAEGGAAQWKATGSDAEDDASTAGWSIADDGESRPATSTGAFSSISSSQSLMIRLKGTTGSP